MDEEIIVSPETDLLLDKLQLGSTFCNLLKMYPQTCLGVPKNFVYFCLPGVRRFCVLSEDGWVMTGPWLGPRVLMLQEHLPKTMEVLPGSPLTPLGLSQARCCFPLFSHYQADCVLISWAGTVLTRPISNCNGYFGERLRGMRVFIWKLPLNKKWRYPQEDIICLVCL